MPDTTYIVLRQKYGNGDYEAIGTVKAGSATNAVRIIAAKPGSMPNDTDETTFVAVPERSFQPVVVKAEHTTVIKIVNATPDPT